MVSRSQSFTLGYCYSHACCLAYTACVHLQCILASAGFGRCHGAACCVHVWLFCVVEWLWSGQRPPVGCGTCIVLWPGADSLRVSFCLVECALSSILATRGALQELHECRAGWRFNAGGHEAGMRILDSCRFQPEHGVLSKTSPAWAYVVAFGAYMMQPLAQHVKGVCVCMSCCGRGSKQTVHRLCVFALRHGLVHAWFMLLTCAAKAHQGTWARGCTLACQRL
jgi:hypothetical protein